MSIFYSFGQIIVCKKSVAIISLRGLQASEFGIKKKFFYKLENYTKFRRSDTQKVFFECHKNLFKTHFHIFLKKAKIISN